MLELFLYHLAKAASQYQAGPPAGQMFRKAVHQERLEPAGPDSNPEEAINRGVVGLISTSCNCMSYICMSREKM